MKVNKIDSARQQLETAASIFFQNGDTISTHTLVCAAYNVLKDLCDKKGTKHYTIKNLDLIKEEHRPSWKRTINRAENYFKHADNDPNSILDFDPEETELILFDALITYHQFVGGKLSIPLGVFKLWFVTKYPDSLIPSERDRIVQGIRMFSSNSNLDAENLPDYYEKVSAILTAN